MNNASKILLAIGASAAVGAILGVLYAPEEGYETRKRIIKRRLAPLVMALTKARNRWRK